MLHHNAYPLELWLPEDEDELETLWLRSDEGDQFEQVVLCEFALHGDSAALAQAHFILLSPPHDPSRHAPFGDITLYQIFTEQTGWHLHALQSTQIAAVIDVMELILHVLAETEIIPAGAHINIRTNPTPLPAHTTASTPLPPYSVRGH